MKYEKKLSTYGLDIEDFTWIAANDAITKAL
jgi:hypothetical protein